MIKGTSLKTIVESQGLNETERLLSESLKSGELKPSDFSWGEMVRCLVHQDGEIALKALSGYQKTGNPVQRVLSETIDVSAFNTLQGQILFGEMRVGWERAENRISSMIPTRQTKISGEKIPGIGLMSRYGYKIHAGEPIPQADFGQWYVQTAPIEKSALICDVTWEAAYYDRTGDLLERARDVGNQLAKNKELRCCSVVSGATLTLDNQTFSPNNYALYKGALGGAFNTYSTSTQTTSSVSIQANALASTPIVDEVAVETLAQLATEQLHPDNGQRLAIRSQLNTLIVMPAKRQTVRRFMDAREIRNTTNTTVNTYGPRDVLPYELVISDTLYGQIIDSGIAAANAKDWYFLCNPSKAWVYMQVRPLDIEQAPALGDLAFQNDLVLRVRGIEMGVPQVLDPRYTYKGYNS